MERSLASLSSDGDIHCKIKGSDDLFVDAMQVGENRDLVFVSVWGHDTAIQQLIARMSLPVAQGGIDRVTIEPPQGTIVGLITNDDSFEKLSAKTAANTVFGALTNLWIYSTLLNEPDVANRRAVMLSPMEEEFLFREQRVWEVVTTLCHLPLLPHWQDVVMAHFKSRQLIVDEVGYRVDGTFISLETKRVEEIITGLVKSGYLSELPQEGPRVDRELIELFGQPVSTYTRAQAFEDGVLIDVSSEARRCGYNVPVAINDVVWRHIAPNDDFDCALLVALFQAAIRAAIDAGNSLLETPMDFDVVYPPHKHLGTIDSVSHRISSHGGDFGEPVLTIES